MNNKDLPAFPQDIQFDKKDHTGAWKRENKHHFGLSKRELGVFILLQGILASGRTNLTTEEENIKAAINYTDALLQQLQTDNNG